MSDTTPHPLSGTLNHQLGPCSKQDLQNCKILEHVFPTLSSLKRSPPLNFGTPETLAMNPDPPTYLTNTETTKLIHLKSLAENVVDGFSTEQRIIRNPILGTGNTLPKKRPSLKSSTTKLSKQPKVYFTTESQDSIPESDPTTLDQPMKRPDWPQ